MARFTLYTKPRGLPLLEPTIETINGIEEMIRWAESEVPKNMQAVPLKLAYAMALVNQSYARKMSYGPLDSSGRNKYLAWRTPQQGIRRISQRYYLGWKVKISGLDRAILYNDSREAYFIEFGISEVGWGSNRFVPAGRIRRPVQKLSLKKTLDYMMRTQAYHRVYADIFAHPRHTSKGFTQIVQSPGQSGSMTALGITRPASADPITLIQ